MRLCGEEGGMRIPLWKNGGERRRFRDGSRLFLWARNGELDIALVSQDCSRCAPRRVSRLRPVRRGKPFARVRS